MGRREEKIEGEIKGGKERIKEGEEGRGGVKWENKGEDGSLGEGSGVEDQKGVGKWTREGEM
jgi:hypothetical protein